ncbi:MAG: monofunctional biosynthetic peptidoglycan transglycosylase, partial [Flavobacteriales bacterium]
SYSTRWFFVLSGIGFVMKKFLRFFLLLLSVLIFIPMLYVWILGFLPIGNTALMQLRYSEAGRDTSFHVQHAWVSYDEISRHLKLAVICTEDPNFHKHMGFDFKAIEQAREYNKTHENKRGASTISQQTAKNVFLWPGRNYVRKGFEAYFTYLMEICWSKKRILEVYLNSIEMGNGIFGAQAAAQKYFKKNAANLTMYEAALIAVSLPNPRKLNPAHPGPYMVKRAWWVVSYMKKYGHLLTAIEQ